MAFIRGENVIVQFFDDGQWKLYACARGCTLNVDTDIIETSVTGRGQWGSFLPTKHTWDMSIDGLVNLDQPNMLSLPDLRAKQIGKELLIISYQRTDQAGNVYTDKGTAYITNSSDSGNYTDANTFNISLKGSGALTQSFIPTTSNEPAVQKFYYTAVGGEDIVDNAVLVNQSIIGVFVDGIEYQIINNGTPGDKQVLYTSSLGQFTFPINFEPNEHLTVLYQQLTMPPVGVHPYIFDTTFSNKFN